MTRGGEDISVNRTLGRLFNCLNFEFENHAKYMQSTKGMAF